MADGSIFYSHSLMDNGETVGDNMTNLHTTNLEAYRKMYEQSEKIARLYYWFVARIPSAVMTDFDYNRESEPILVE
jgi:hypothetical protein